MTTSKWSRAQSRNQGRDTIAWIASSFFQSALTS